MRKAITLFIAASLLTSFSIGQVFAQDNSPVLPDRAVINKVIGEAGGPDRVPLNIPNVILDGMNSYAANSVKNAPPQVDPAKASILITQTEVQRMVVPVVGAESMKLAPNTTTINDGLPAMVIGGSYETSAGLSVLVAVWAKNNDLKPSELRFYADGGARHSTPYKLHTRKLKGKGGKVAPVDAGVLIAARETCITIGLDQVCYDQTTPETGAPEIAEAALERLEAVYSFKAKFDIQGALPDLAGNDVRETCAESLESANTGEVEESCGATLIFTAAEKIEAGEPIALFSVLRDIEMEAYDVQGNLVGTLPAGDYLVFDATPGGTPDAGTPDALYLVNADGTTHRLIPSFVSEAFGTTDDPAGKLRGGQAAIKFGTANHHDF